MCCVCLRDITVCCVCHSKMIRTVAFTNFSIFCGYFLKNKEKKIHSLLARSQRQNFGLKSDQICAEKTI